LLVGWVDFLHGDLFGLSFDAWISGGPGFNPNAYLK